jgi:hypothetical protein
MNVNFDEFLFIQFLAWGRDFSFSPKLQTSSWTYLASHSMGNMCPFLASKAAVA